MYQILKYPEYENDDALINFFYFKVDNKKLTELLKKDPYFALKYKKFSEQDTSFKGFEKFRNRPSMKGFNSESIIISTIYTNSAMFENYMPYKDLLKSIKLKLRKDNRRVILRFLNSYTKYYGDKDVSCLAYLQYFYSDYGLELKIVYRASDIKNEFFYDVVLIYEFFVRPIISEPIKISFYTTTAQNIIELNEECKKISLIGHK